MAKNVAGRQNLKQDGEKLSRASGGGHFKLLQIHESKRVSLSVSPKILNLPT